MKNHEDLTLTIRNSISSDKNKDLPSGKTIRSYWKMAIYSWFTRSKYSKYSKWWFSTVMLVYQRVAIQNSKNDSWSFQPIYGHPWCFLQFVAKICHDFHSVPSNVSRWIGCLENPMDYHQFPLNSWKDIYPIFRHTHIYIYTYIIYIYIICCWLYIRLYSIKSLHVSPYNIPIKPTINKKAPLYLLLSLGGNPTSHYIIWL